MLNMINKNYTFTGNSTNNSDNNTIIADFYAARDNNALSITININDLSLFDFSTIDNDFFTFKNNVLTECGLINNEEEVEQ